MFFNCVLRCSINPSLIFSGNLSKKDSAGFTYGCFGDFFGAPVAGRAADRCRRGGSVRGSFLGVRAADRAAGWLCERQFSVGPVPQDRAAGWREATFCGSVPQDRAAGWLCERQFSGGQCRRTVPHGGSVRGNFLGVRAAGTCRRVAL